MLLNVLLLVNRLRLSSGRQLPHLHFNLLPVIPVFTCRSSRLLFTFALATHLSADEDQALISDETGDLSVAGGGRGGGRMRVMKRRYPDATSSTRCSYTPGTSDSSV
ncbi:unnamed protein product [Pleuronectes platessa]|uniref:Secreted protein n=1 Tax=Pleuronectes platessa TaxID=8262 RepID=A0A9N7YJN8_PLEPL|nr:unnamed protein product [Pleuronectes platessa]